MMSALQELCERYADGDPETDREYMSSHWKFYSSRCRVSLDSNGRITRLHGDGFGDFMVKNRFRRMLTYAGHLLYLTRLNHRVRLLKSFMIADSVAKRMGGHFSSSAFVQVCAWDLIQSSLSQPALNRPLRVMIIGDGYGFLASYIKTRLPDAIIILVDIGKSLIFQSYYCARAHPDAEHSTMRAWAASDMPSAGFIYCSPDETARIPDGSVDVSVSIASMQEMNAMTVCRYFDVIRRVSRERDNLFYCCNRESKTLMGGECSTFYDYPWMQEDSHRVDGDCPWYTFFLSPDRTPRGLTIKGMRVPFVNYFDGDFKHRLSCMAPRSANS